jgi:hypothetical protein
MNRMVHDSASLRFAPAGCLQRVIRSPFGVAPILHGATHASAPRASFQMFFTSVTH